MYKSRYTVSIEYKGGSFWILRRTFLSKINENSSSKNVEEWDSLGHLSILSAIDNALDGKASDLTDLANADSVGKIIKILESNKLI